MADERRDEAPRGTGLTRRQLIVGGVILGGTVAAAGAGIWATTRPGDGTRALPDAESTVAAWAESDALPAATFPIGVAAGGRSFVDAAGVPFSYLADTAWNAVSRMTREEFSTLVQTRRAQGFTAIQLSILDFDVRAPNRYGAYPLRGQPERVSLQAPRETPGRSDDPHSDAYDYWDHLEWCVDVCADNGLIACLVPAWFGGGGFNWRGYFTEDVASSYGQFLARRLGDRSNVWWLHGGDNDPSDVEAGGVDSVPDGLPRQSVETAVNDLARALKAGAGVEQLASYHTYRNGNVERYFGDQDWYDISAAYSDALTHPRVMAEYDRSIVRPVVLWEAYYAGRENAPVLDRVALRAQAYSAFLSGAAGFGAGHEEVWPVRDSWAVALVEDSAADMSLLSRFVASHSGEELVPDAVPDAPHRVLVSGQGAWKTIDYATAARSADGRLAAVYFPSARDDIEVALEPFLSGGSRAHVEWVSPATGRTAVVGTALTSESVRVAYPPGWDDALLTVRSRA